MWRHSGHRRGPWLASGFALAQRGTGCNSQTRAVGVTGGAQPPARLCVDLGAERHGHADLVLGYVTLGGCAAFAVRLDVLLAHRLLLQKVADLHDVADDLHGAGHGLFAGREVVFHFF